MRSPAERPRRATRSAEPLPAQPSRDAAIRRALGAWYDASARDLPWRRTRDPYAIWLSEIMLQQTRVDTVIPYFERFLGRFPSVEALAAAPIDEVLSQWSGLGYYRRARQLHVAAREVTERYGGALPASASELQTLHGVGAYTAGAIASIAFDRPEPLVDGNVARVLARLEGIGDDIRGAAGLRRLWQAAARLVPDEHPGRWNQAVMELGATVCTPREPRCPACPLAAWCVAAVEGRVAQLPVVGPKKAPRAVNAVAMVLRRQAKVLLGRRRPEGLFGGMWEPPMVEAPSLSDALVRFAAFGLDPPLLGKLREIGQVKHVLSHQKLAIVVIAAEAPRALRPVVPAASAYDTLSWLEFESIAAPWAAHSNGAEALQSSRAATKVGVSTLAKKILAVNREW